MQSRSADNRGRGLQRYAASLVSIAALSLMLLSTGLISERVAAKSGPYVSPTPQANMNYGEALQKAIWFYEAQISGPKPSFSRVSWRGDSALGDGSDVGRDLRGGWFDAGDHVKFGFAMASSATMLAWGGVEYRQAYQDSGQLTHLLNNLRVANDYFIKAHTSANELYGQVGDAGLDHSFWGSAEIMQMARPSFKIDLAHGGSDLASETAAAMAASSIVFRPTDPAYADTLVSHARQLFAFAEATYHPNDFNTNGNGNFYVDAIPAAQGFYNSRFGNPADEMTWGAVWLFLATNDTTFRDRARQLYPTMCKENGTQTPCFTWTQSWNDKHFGTYVLMAKITGEEQFKTDAQRWLDFWSVGSGTRTTGGLMFVNGFGSLRYATNTAFIALVYADFLGTANALYPRYHDFAKRQIDYCLGANPANHSYVCGFGVNPPINPHHRTAHGSWVNGGPSGAPTNSRHVLYGGLVCGPTSANDFAWADDRSQFMENEVATDFNAGFAGALARLFREFGGTPLANFPQIETPDDDEIYIEAGINVAGTNFTEIRAFVVNRSAWPARMLDGGTFRYFFTLEPGVTPSQITVNQNFSQCTGGITGPIQWSGNIYYVQINCLGTKIFPGGQSEFRREVQFRITSSGAWNPADDPSFQDISGAINGQVVRTRRIVLYDDGVRIWGNEPGAGNNSPTVTLTSPANGATFTAPATVAMAANATDSDGTIARVEFLNGSTVVGTDTTAPYTFSLTGLAAGNYQLSARAVDNLGAVGVSNIANITVNPSMTPDFSLSANPASLTITVGGSGTSTITITRTGGFTGSVAFSTGTLPTGVTASFNPASTTGNTTVLTLSASSTAPPVLTTVSVNGVGGGLTRSTSVALTVVAPDFTAAANPSSLSIAQGASGTSTINLTRTGGFASSVAFTISTLPNGVTATFNPTSTTANSSTLTLAASATAATGQFPLTVTCTGGGLTRTAPLTLTVTTAGGGNGGVTITPVINASGPWFNEEALRLSNTGTITSMSMTIVIQRTGGISFNGQYNTVGGQITQSNSSTATAITYQFTLAAGQTLGPGNSRTFAAQTSGTGTVHPMAGDTYTVTYTTGGVTFTQTGHF